MTTLSFFSSSSEDCICPPKLWKLEYTSCSTRPRSVAMIIEASRVSRKTMKKIGTEKRLWVMVSEGKRADRAWRKGLE
jgi:hypothetical protein